MQEFDAALVEKLSVLIEKTTTLVEQIANQSNARLTTTIWVAGGVIGAALIARGVKISEFRQTWINDLRADIAAYMSKADKWMDCYIIYNAEANQEKKKAMSESLQKTKYACFQTLRRIEMRFRPNDANGDALIQRLRDLLDPARTQALSSIKSEWTRLADAAVGEARILLKEEWEVTKNPLKKICQFWHRKTK